MTPETPAEYRKAIADMRMTNPFVHRAITMQEINGLSNEDMLSILAYHVIKSNDTITAAHMDLLKRMPPQPLIVPNVQINRQANTLPTEK